MSTVVGPCAEAAKSPDARDKYFMTYASSFDPSPAKALASELPPLQAAETSLSVAVSKLADVLPQLAACKPTPVSFVGAGSHPFEPGRTWLLRGAPRRAAAPRSWWRKPGW